jgi:hypothetical protein
MMAIYNYMHERHINKAAAIKNLQDMYMKWGDAYGKGKSNGRSAVV